MSNKSTVETEGNYRFHSVVPIALVIIAFGPYLSRAFGIRSEHVYYLFALLSLLLAIVSQKRFFVSRKSMISAAILVFISLWTTIVTLYDPHYSSIFKVVSGMDRYMRPVAILVILSISVSGYTRPVRIHALRNVCLSIVIALSLNACFSIISSITDTSAIIDVFTAAAGRNGLTIAERSAQMGRYIGVFNQPFECGMAYSIGLIIWGYLHHGKKASVSGYSTLLLLIAGGVLSVSKVLLLGGLPLFFLYTFYSRNSRLLVSWKFALLLALASALAFSILRDWNGLPRILRLANTQGIGSNGAVTLYTAGRFGEGGEIPEAFKLGLRTAPIAGLGFDSLDVLDNGYLEFFIQGGVVCLVGYIILLCLLLQTAFRDIRQSKEAKFLFFLCLLGIGGGVGGPALTCARASSVFWILVFLTIELLRRQCTFSPNSTVNSHLSFHDKPSDPTVFLLG